MALRGVWLYLILLSFGCQPPPPCGDGGDGGSTLGAWTFSKEYCVTIEPAPSPIPFNEYFSLNVQVFESDQITLANHMDVTVDAGMPQHSHGMNTTTEVMLNSEGSYDVEGMLFHMTGEWTVTVNLFSEPEWGDDAVFSLECCVPPNT